MLRTWRLQTLTGAAQPLFGDVTTAAVVAPPQGGDVIVQVADTTLYQIGDRIVLNPQSISQNILLVDAKPSGTWLLCKAEGDAKVSAYASGTTIALAMPAMEIMVQNPYAGSNLVWIGSDSTVTSAGAGNAIFAVASSLPYRMTNSAQHNTVRTTDAWMAAIAGTQVIVSATIL